MRYEDIIQEAKKMQAESPRWRFGQAVFNYCDIALNGIARAVQFEDGIDCYYSNDENVIKEFIEAVLRRVNKCS